MTNWYVSLLFHVVFLDIVRCVCIDFCSNGKYCTVWYMASLFHCCVFVAPRRLLSTFRYSEELSSLRLPSVLEGDQWEELFFKFYVGGGQATPRENCLVFRGKLYGCTW